MIVGIKNLLFWGYHYNGWKGFSHFGGWSVLAHEDHIEKVKQDIVNEHNFFALHQHGRPNEPIQIWETEYNLGYEI